MLKRIYRHPAVLAAAAWLLGGYLALVYRSIRWTLVGFEHVAPFPEAQAPVIAAFWHERLPLMPRMWQAAAARLPAGVSWPAQVLVSRSRDGRFIGAIVGRFGLEMVHASTNRGGSTGLRELLRVLAGGHAVVITPDGPRGPRRVAVAGVAQLAALSGVPVLPCAAATSRRVLLPSWDRMMLPLPFGRGVVVCGPPIFVARDAAAAALPAIEAAMTAACDAADAWVTAP